MIHQEPPRLRPPDDRFNRRFPRKQAQAQSNLYGCKMDWLTGTAIDRRLKPLDVRVVVILAKHFNQDSGEAYPTRETIAELIGASVATVKRSLARLRKYGWLTVRHRKSAKGLGEKEIHVERQFCEGVIGVVPVMCPKCQHQFEHETDPHPDHAGRVQDLRTEAESLS